MRAVIQRVSKCNLTADGTPKSMIKHGLVVLLGIEDADNDEDIDWLCGKIAKLRIFDDADGVMNLSVQEVNGEIMVVSQFTLHASTKKGNRPSYQRAAKPEKAQEMYNKFVQKLQSEMQTEIATGKFQSHMLVDLINDGPVTIIMDTKNKE